MGGENVTLKNVMYVPDLSYNVLSVKKLWKDNRIETHFGERCYMRDTTRRGLKRFYFAGDQGSLYHVGYISFGQISETLLHRRLGHCGVNRMRVA